MEGLLDNEQRVGTWSERWLMNDVRANRSVDGQCTACGHILEGLLANDRRFGTLNECH